MTFTKLHTRYFLTPFLIGLLLRYANIQATELDPATAELLLQTLSNNPQQNPFLASNHTPPRVKIIKSHSPHPHRSLAANALEEDEDDLELLNALNGHLDTIHKSTPPSTLEENSHFKKSREVPDPIFTREGIHVGGSQANGVLSQNQLGPIKIDDETAEGGKALVTDFNFPDADILDIAKTLGKLTGKNFIFDKDIKGKITIISNAPITVSEAWKAFLTALDMNGFAIIPSGKYLRIARQRDARDKQLKTYAGDFSPNTDALITRIFQLKYISAEEVARTFRGFMPTSSRIMPYDQTNTVIVTDTGSNIHKLAKMLEILDVEGFDAGIEVVPVKYASAAELAKLIDALIPGTTATSSSNSSAGTRFGAISKFNARRTKEGGIINTIFADERTNNLIVHANSKGVQQIRELVAKLDQNIPSATGGKVHVVYLQFADAEQLANTLSNFSSQGSIKSNPPSGGGGSEPTSVGSNPVTNSLFEGSIKISPDKSTNALVITASPTDFITVKRVINRLDIPRDQVYVEVIIMEVAVSNSFDYSASIMSLPSAAGSITSPDMTSFLTNPLSATGGLIGLPIGSPTTINLPNGGTQTVSSVFGLIRALQSNTNTNILATPQIIALDNTEANFESSEKIPIAVSTFVQGVGSQQTINKEPVALSIKIKPQINKITNFVKLDVTAKLGEIQMANVPSSLANQAFGSTDRSAQTTVIIADADTVVLGGLMRDKLQQTVKKIPLLGDIPILGWLFKSTTPTVQKSNLLIFMTPHIIRQYEKVREILNKKLKERDRFLESSTGGEDLLKQERNQIIESLPNLKEMSPVQPDPAITIDTINVREEPPAAVEVSPPQ